MLGDVPKWLKGLASNTSRSVTPTREFKSLHLRHNVETKKMSHEKPDYIGLFCYPNGDFSLYQSTGLSFISCITVAGDAAGKSSKAANKTLGVAGDVAKHSKKASTP